ncbi:uncharacterized protein TRIREDRAFT_104923 [Trichoderma reesei QM6a]|uniref:Predicted protein n=2 Tax=Hypocrea jecorina TaxID=51453 RepID=G0RCY2_HYPJQ|nr:uncharacterized protein TRIREDRAFT_104923 [Trichoderma reesei QM6a]EGR50882.1 predicted protein [Trichoderma reesei QM6a]ETS05606.1 hypothetical protein M419DRAFT_71389 [Trichoderma reesei RUT C-30]
MSAATSPNAVPNPLQPDVAALKATHRGSAEDGRKLINLILCCVDQLGCSTSHTAENISILTPTGARINSYHKNCMIERLAYMYALSDCNSGDAKQPTASLPRPNLTISHVTMRVHLKQKRA